ncbi:DUF167 domain-containing protein [Labedaea rhizosphaerae]|uniref:UPF0235 protein EV186_103164 n=1 Tax=Labedaea rhizosphaerae TaxID=598644 RepID=A0A4R6SB97_LABRH|nr:DUF167 domain-containing protein [Labedaea rhizosphaerae]TDP97202.1 hypothetical protein EV186_103164 [Labedaea rhizosphaerae]
MTAFRFAIRVKPGASRDAVGGRWRADALIVAVRAKAVDGKANATVLAVLAEAFGVRPNRLAIVTGEHARDKVIDLDPAPEHAQAVLIRLLDS